MTILERGGTRGDFFDLVCDSKKASVASRLSSGLFDNVAAHSAM